MKIIKRLKSPVPSLIKRVQKISGAIGGLAVIISAATAQYPDMHVPSWIWKVILGALVVNHLILQSTTNEDFHDGEADK